MFNSQAFKMTANVLKTIDKTDNITKAFTELLKRDVLVGIPQEKSSRKGEELTNAELAYVLEHGAAQGQMAADIKNDIALGQTYSQARQAYLHTHGDVIQGIPPRPFLEPAIEDAKDPIAQIEGEILVAALDGDMSKMNARMKKLGLFAKNKVQLWFTNPKNGWPPNTPATIRLKKSAQPNVDTGQLFQSISYVIRGNDAHD